MRSSWLPAIVAGLSLAAGDLSAQTSRWFPGGSPSHAALVMTSAMLGAEADGLAPADYGAGALDSVVQLARSVPLPADSAVRMDEQLTGAASRFLGDLRGGRTGVRYALPDARPDPWDAAAALDAALRGDSVAALIESARPPFTQYRSLARVLARYRTAPPDTAPESGVPSSRRIRQLELAMERLRWLPRIHGERFLVVNTPAFELIGFDSVGGTGEAAIRMRVIVGKAKDRPTPMLVGRLQFVEFRPYWNVPSSILRAEILPLIRRSPDYLRANDMEIVTSAGEVAGDLATPALLHALAVGAARVRQRPGDSNALGLVKLVFPNGSNVYLHGTPAPELFARPRRDFSHGCIRVEDPVSLATWVLAQDSGWTRESVTAAAAGPASSRVTLAHGMPVFVYYTTAVVRPDGAAYFYPDLYAADRSLEAALRAGRPLPQPAR